MKDFMMLVGFGAGIVTGMFIYRYSQNTKKVFNKGEQKVVQGVEELEDKAMQGLETIEKKAKKGFKKVEDKLKQKG